MTGKYDHNVMLNRLVLEGFGCYPERTEFDFSPGINCYVAENETGKTTMVAGLIATLFGLSHRRRSVSSFTLERFRNWDNPQRCSGEVYFSVGEEDYLVRRDFDTHRVELRAMDGDGGKLIVEGEHNPEARKKLQRYDEMLLELLGLNSIELFGDTFCVGQPLPEPDKISGELQGLLAGGKGTSFDRALQNLADNLKSLTKYTGPHERGITARNQNKDRQLELLAERIKGMERQIEDGRQTADSFLSVQEELSETVEESQQIGRELEEKEKANGAWSGWIDKADKYRHANLERNKLEREAEDARKLHERIKEWQSEFEREFPAFVDAPAETGDRLVELDNCEIRLRETEKKIKEFEESLDEGKKTLLKQMEAYDRFSARELLGGDPVEKLKNIKRSAENCRQEWEEFKEALEERNKIDVQLKDEFAPFEDASRDELEMAREYNQHHTRLKDAAAKAQRELAKFDDYREARSGYDEKYADLQGLPEDATALVEGKLEILKRKRELEIGAGGEVPRVTSLLPGLLGALVSVIVVGMIIGTGNIAFLIIAAVISGVAGYWLGGLAYRLIVGLRRKRKDAHTPGKIQKIMTDLADYDRKLGSYAAWSEADLGRLAERLRHSEHERQRLALLAGELPSEGEMERLRQRAEETSEDLQDYEQKMAGFAAHPEGIPVAYTRWQNLLDQKQTVLEKLRVFAEQKLGCNLEEAENADPRADEAAEEWKETARFLSMKLGETEIEKAADMAERLNGLPDTWWMEQAEEAAELARLMAEIEKTKNTVEGQEKRLEEEKKNLAGLQEEKADLLGLLPGIPEAYNGDTAVALARWKEMQKLSRDSNEADIELKTILGRNDAEEVSDLESICSRARDQAVALMKGWQEYIEQNAGLPGIDRADDLEHVADVQKKLKAEIAELREKEKQLKEKRNELFKQQ
ncbi:MAG: AAA family ATPase, partial [Firmicutes bacterium]|nr:AAA family ATPase [Bacillota bacterium]